MKKLFAKHKLTQKIFLSIIIVLLLSFTVPVKSHAGLGGLLLDPVFDLLGTVIDVVTGGLQLFLVDGEMNNSEGSSGLNFFLAEKDDFMERVNSGDEAYKEFAYHTGSGESEVTISEDDLDNILGASTYAIPVLRYTPEKIFGGRIPALDINFVNPTDWSDSKMNDRSIAVALHETIASWYVSLRNLSVVGLMLVLVYVGIRIVISSTASDRAKYKQMLMDWVVALCLVFCLHYIMTFTTTIVTEITDAIIGSDEEHNGNNIAVTITPGTNNYDEDQESIGGSHTNPSMGTNSQTPEAHDNDTEEPDTQDEDDEESEDSEDSSSGGPVQFNTDIMGLIRLKMQSPTVAEKILYLILYLAMVIYTCMFTFQYLKRVLMMAFLTLISPLVALTYPIDKIKDGKAQAFDMWLKEYIFNALLQPFHLIIYSIFVGSAVDLAARNPIYAIIALAFLTPAEKILRKFFGFEKASTAGALGAVAGAVGGAAVMRNAKNLLSPKSGGGSGSGKKGIKTKQRIEDDTKSLGESLGGAGGTNNSNEEENKDATPRMSDTTQDENTTNESANGQRLINGTYTANASDVNVGIGQDGSLDINYTDADTGERRNLVDLINETDNANAVAARSPETGAMEAPSTTTSGGINNQIRTHGRGAFSWSDNDTRGIGGYALDAVKHGAGTVGGKIASTQVGQGAIKLGRTVSGGAKSVKDMAEKGINKIPKPIRNTAKGLSNVAVKTGVSAGKAALKAAPGAVFGMAAGIAGDELGDIAKYTLAGAALSSTMGSSAITQAGSFIADAYNEGAHSSTESTIERQKSEYIKDTSWDNYYRQEIKGKDGKELTNSELKAKKTQGAYYDSRGIQGEDAIKAVKLEDKIKQEIGAQQGEEFDPQAYTARIMKIAKPYSADKLRKPSEVENLTNSITKELIKGGFDQKTASDQAKVAVKYVKQAKGIKDE